MSFRCPCGCPLQLDAEDMAHHRRLDALLGPVPSSRRINLRTNAERAIVRNEPAEPVERGTCRSCGEPMTLFAYLAASLRLRGAPWPLCVSCTEGRQAELGFA